MATSSRQQGFVVCVRNRGYAASLEPRKVYVRLKDDAAAAHGLLRVIDESGEDYLFPERLFEAVELPHRARRAFAAAS
jgi:hypothetical protein